MEVLSSRTILRPSDFEASRHFYQEVLGLHVYREYGVDGRVTGVVLFTGNGFLELATVGGGMPNADRGASLWLQVPDVDHEHERLREAGVAAVEPPRTMAWGLREMWLADPDGVRIVLVEVPEDHPLRRRV
jgi:catechol 2,3-dioxygenase-like lactoylglutathione lyase family enzyme